MEHLNWQTSGSFALWGRVVYNKNNYFPYKINKNGLQLVMFVRVNAKIVTMPAKLHPMPVRSPWHHVRIDFVGPIIPVSSSAGNMYILTLSDYCMKLVETVSLENKEAPGVVIFLQKVNKTESTQVASLHTNIMIMHLLVRYFFEWVTPSCWLVIEDPSSEIRNQHFEL